MALLVTLPLHLKAGGIWGRAQYWREGKDKTGQGTGKRAAEKNLNPRCFQLHLPHWQKPACFQFASEHLTLRARNSLLLNLGRHLQLVHHLSASAGTNTIGTRSVQYSQGHRLLGQRISGLIPCPQSKENFWFSSFLTPGFSFSPLLSYTIAAVLGILAWEMITIYPTGSTTGAHLESSPLRWALAGAGGVHVGLSPHCSFGFGRQASRPDFPKACKDLWLPGLPYRFSA